MFRTKAVEKIQTRIVCSETVFRKSCRLRDNGRKYCRVGQATDVNMAHEHCIPKTTNTNSCSTILFDFSTATKVARTHLNITLYVEIKCQLDATEVFIADLIACSTSFGHHYAHHQEPKSIMWWLLPVVFGAVVFKLLVWCEAKGYVSGLQENHSTKYHRQQPPYNTRAPDDGHSGA